MVDGEDVRADAHALEGLARRAVEQGGVALAVGDAVLLARLAHEVEGVADVDEALDVLAARVLDALERALVLRDERLGDGCGSP